MVELVESLCGRGSADAVAEGIRESMEERVPEDLRRDDVALVVLRITPR
jgi:hypothetical protein